MFPNRYFPVYFANRYWPTGVQASQDPPDNEGLVAVLLRNSGQFTLRRQPGLQLRRPPQSTARE